MAHDSIAVIDFGGQYAHLIATKVRRRGVLAEIRQPEDPVDAFRDYRGIIISGSPSLASHGEDSVYTKEIYDLDVPILGLCFGHQEIARHYGGEVIHGGREWGRARLELVGEHEMFDGLGPSEQVWMSHYDSVVSVGPEFHELGFSAAADGSPAHRFAAIGSDSLRRYGFQFHPEVDDTVNGDRMLENFVLRICRCEPSWSMDEYLEREAGLLRERVGDRSVFLLASGGVDSTVAAALLGRSLGPERLHLLHIDNGLMRKDESRRVVDLLAGMGLDENLHFVDASDTFLEALDGLVAPEDKRRAIGETFIRVFEEQARALGIEDHLLGQGTIYPDTIETGGTKRSDTIKTHHNRVPVIDEMIAAGKVVEPLADLYKVEVRELGESLGIPREVVWRHPFPGPGLGVRLLCSDGEPDIEGFDEIEAALPEVAAEFGLRALPLPLRSVGVKADLRAYEHPVMLSAGEVSGGMPGTTTEGAGDAGTGVADGADAPGADGADLSSADGAAIPAWETLLAATSKITSQVPGINRCVWNLGPRAPVAARPIRATVTRERLEVLRQADHLVMEALRRHGLYDEVWQCPTVLVPVALDFGTDPDDETGELVILRPVMSQRAMTATPVELSGAICDELREAILDLPGVGGLALDVTSKPPGTIEWE